jgi:hypothetical protein
LKLSIQEKQSCADLGKIGSKTGTYSKHADFKEKRLLERLSCIKHNEAFNRAGYKLFQTAVLEYDTVDRQTG